MEQLSYDIHVTSPLRHSVNVNRVYKNCPIVIQDIEFSVDLIVFTFHYHPGKANVVADALSQKSRGALASIASLE